MSTSDICLSCGKFWNLCLCRKSDERCSQCQIPWSHHAYNCHKTFNSESIMEKKSLCTECNLPLPQQAYGQTGTDGLFCSNYCLQRHINKQMESATLDTSVVIDYIVLHSDSTQSLETKVHQCLKQGWQLQGGVSISSAHVALGSIFYSYAQAMVKYG